MKLYHYKTCSTCKKAIKYLNSKDVDHELISIVDTPPSKEELNAALKDYDGNIKKLFNTSGQVYRNEGVAEKLKTMSDEEAIDLLHSNGKLIKRPFTIFPNKTIVGFKEDLWEEALTN